MIYFIIGVVLGWFLHRYMVKLAIARTLKRAEEEIKQHKQIMMRIEKHKGIFYLYNKETEEFIAQGKNKEEINEVIQKKYASATEKITFHIDAEEIKRTNFK